MPTDEVARPAAWQVVDVLKTTRELLTGLTYGEHEGWLERTPEHQTMFVMTLCEQVVVLDLFLTGSIRARTTEVDLLAAAGIVVGTAWRVMLSDAQSVLVLRKPTKDDQLYLYLDDETRQVAFRWTLIDLPDAQPEEFPLREDFLR